MSPNCAFPVRCSYLLFAHPGVGTVAKLGPGASGRIKEGERVVGVGWTEPSVGNGTWQQYMVVREKGLVGAQRPVSPLMSSLLHPTLLATGTCVLPALLRANGGWGKAFQQGRYVTGPHGVYGVRMRMNTKQGWVSCNGRRRAAGAADGCWVVAKARTAARVPREIRSVHTNPRAESSSTIDTIQSVVPTLIPPLVTLAQVPVPPDLPDEAACQALINPVTVMGLFEMIKAPQGRCWLLGGLAWIDTHRMHAQSEACGTYGYTVFVGPARHLLGALCAADMAGLVSPWLLFMGQSR